MRHVAAYILAVMGGKANPTEKDLKSILSSVGIEADSTNLSIVINQLKGKNVFQVIEEGQALLADLDIGAGGLGSGGGGAAKAVEAVVEEEPVEEKKPVVESSDETDSDMGMGLFDD